MTRGKRVNLSESEGKEFLAKRAAEFEEILPLNDRQWDVLLGEYKWIWEHHYICAKNDKYESEALRKVNLLRREADFWRTLRPYKPLALQYPSAFQKLTSPGLVAVPHPECRRHAINPSSFANIEKVAGFSYPDFAKEVYGKDRTKWTLPQVGDTVEGKVMRLDRAGAFLDIGDKGWAWMPLHEVSLLPISKAGEVLTRGEVVTVVVIAKARFNRLDRDQRAPQLIVSLTSLQSGAAWDKIRAKQRGEDEDQNPFVKCTVLSLRTWGAVVQTDTGLEALIPRNELGDKEGDTSIVGETLTTKIVALREESIDRTGPAFGPADFALILSYKDQVEFELAEKLSEGQVITVVVRQMRPLEVQVAYEGVRFTIRKIDISGKTTVPLDQFQNLFEDDEEIKVMVYGVEGVSGTVRFSTRALESYPGQIYEDKEAVFKNAEEVAVKYMERANAEKEKLLSSLDDVLDAGSPSPSFEGPQPTGTLDMDDEIDDAF